MDKIMSTRMDESIIRRIGMLAGKTGKTKKAIIEDAIRLYAEKIEAEQEFDVLSHTLGAWNRKEPANDTVRRVKKAMRSSLERYKR
jgi:predicted DNA-binding protein